MIRVYHGPDDFVLTATFLDDDELRARAARQLKDYHLIAEVCTDDLDDAYRLTNTIEAPWWSNPGVQFFGSVEHGLKGARSTSVGDILECVNKDRYAVGRAGFVLLAKNS